MTALLLLAAAPFAVLGLWITWGVLQDRAGEASWRAAELAWRAHGRAQLHRRE